MSTRGDLCPADETSTRTCGRGWSGRAARSLPARRCPALVHPPFRPKVDVVTGTLTLDRLSRAELVALQDRKLRRLFARLRTSPLYRDRLASDWCAAGRTAA